MKTLGTLFLAGALLLVSFSGLAQAANEQDMAKITCKEFLADQANMPMMIMWMDGYMSGKSDNTVVSDEWIGKFGMHLGKYCGTNPGNTIMQAMEAMPAE